MSFPRDSKKFRLGKHLKLKTLETKFKITENWSALKKEIKQKYPILNDLDLNYLASKEDELLARISKKIGKTKEDVIHVITDLQSKITSKSASEKVDSHAETKHAGTFKKH